MNPEPAYLDLLRRFDKEYDHFPDGRINYSGAPEAVVISVFLESEGDILLLKRSQKVGTYAGRWNSVAGYLDELKTAEQIAANELREEVGLSGEALASIQEYASYSFTDSDLGRTWHTVPVLAKAMGRPEITLDWEHTEYVWIKPAQLGEFEVVPHLEDVLVACGLI